MFHIILLSLYSMAVAEWNRCVCYYALLRIFLCDYAQTHVVTD